MLEITIPNRFRKQISIPDLEKAAGSALKACGRAGSDRVVLRISTNRVLKDFNRRFRGMDEVTDVLSFEEEYDDPEDGSHMLGEILISLEKTEEQANAGGHLLAQELEMLLVHGVLHLCGYDHSELDGFQQMSALQDQILSSLGNPLRNSIHAID